MRFAREEAYNWKQVERQKFLNQKKNICKDAMDAVVKMTSYVFQEASHFTVYIMY